VLRTDREHFLDDFFIPSFGNLPVIKSVAERIIIGLSTLVLDLITLPIRLLTLLPRYYSNLKNPKESNPFYQFLAKQGDVPEDLLRLDLVYIDLSKDVPGDPSAPRQTHYVAFKELPADQIPDGGFYSF